MRDEIELRQDGRPQIASGHKRQTAQTGQKAQPQIGRTPGTGSPAHDDRALPADAVLVAVTIVVDHEQRVDDQPAGQGTDERGPCPDTRLYVVGSR